MMTTFHVEAQAALEAGASVEEFRELLVSASARGLSRADAQRVLETMRREAATEAIEDRVLEVLDIVTDFCPQPLRVPWTT